MKAGFWLVSRWREGEWDGGGSGGKLWLHYPQSLLHTQSGKWWSRD